MAVATDTTEGSIVVQQASGAMPRHHMAIFAALLVLLVKPAGLFGRTA